MESQGQMKVTNSNTSSGQEFIHIPSVVETSVRSSEGNCLRDRSGALSSPLQSPFSKIHRDPIDLDHLTFP